MHTPYLVDLTSLGAAMKPKIKVPLIFPDDWRDCTKDLIAAGCRAWESEFRCGQDLTASDIYPTAPKSFRRRLSAQIEAIRIFSEFMDKGTTELHSSEFTVIKDIGEGGQGTVVLATEHLLGRDVAIKIPHEDITSSDVWDRLIHEAKLMSNLEHPGVIPVFGVQHDADTKKPFLVMRHVSHEHTLGDAIQELHMQTDDANRTEDLRSLLRHFVKVCETVQYAHDHNVIHRDIKPDNILVGEYGEVFVVDFGIAQTLQASNKTRRPSGTPAYMSPEQTQVDAEVDNRTDVYALGATLYHLLTAQPPFMTQPLAKSGLAKTVNYVTPDRNSTCSTTPDSPSAPKGGTSILDRVRKGIKLTPREVMPTTPPALEAICLKAMSIQPNHRYGSAGELSEEINRWLDDKPVNAYPDPWREAARRWIKRHRTFVGSTVAAVLVGLVAVSALAAITAYKNDQLTKTLSQTRYLLAAAAWDDGQLDQVRTNLDRCDEGSRHFEWRHLRELSKPPREFRDNFSTVKDVVISDDASVLVAAGVLKDCSEYQVDSVAISAFDVDANRVLQRFTGWSLTYGLKLSHDGNFVAALTTKKEAPFIRDVGAVFSNLLFKTGAPATTDLKLTILNIATGKTHFIPHLEPTESFAFLGDGHELVTALVVSEVRDDGKSRYVARFRIYDVKTGNSTKSFDVDLPYQMDVSLPTKGSLAKLVSSRGFLIFDVATQETVRQYSLPDRNDFTITFSDDNKVAVVQNDLGDFMVYDCLADQSREINPVDGKIIRISPDNRWLLTSKDEGRTANLHDMEKDSWIGEVFDVGTKCIFSSDGATLVNAADNRRLAIWDCRTATAKESIRGCAKKVEYLGFVANADRIVSAGSEGVVRLWDFSRPGFRSVEVGASDVNLLEFVSTGGKEQVFTIDRDGIAKTWEVDTLRPVSEIDLRLYQDEGRKNAHYTTFDPESRRVAQIESQGVRIVDARSGHEISHVPGHFGQVVFFPGGDQLVAIRRDQRLVDTLIDKRMIDDIKGAFTRSQIQADIEDGSLRGVGGDPLLLSNLALESSHIGELKRQTQNTLVIANVETGQITNTLQKSFLDGVLVAPHTRTVYAWKGNNFIRWDVRRDTRSRHVLQRDNDLLTTFGLIATMGRDNHRLLINNTSSLTIWNTKTWKSEVTLPGASLPIVFTSDRNRMVSNFDKGIRLWDTEIWEPVWTFEHDHESLAGLRISRNDEYIIAAAANRLLVWDGPKVENRGR